LNFFKAYNTIKHKPLEGLINLTLLFVSFVVFAVRFPLQFLLIFAFVVTLKFLLLRLRSPGLILLLCSRSKLQEKHIRKNKYSWRNTVQLDIREKGAVTLSSTEAEYYSLSECAQESIFTQNLFKELTMIKQTAIIYEDNLGGIFLTKNQQVSQRTKQIDIRQHFLRELVAKKLLEVKFIKSENNTANTSDITSKNTPGALHEKHTTNIKQGHLNCWKEDVLTDKAKIHIEKDN
jgi:hypothetical protein